MKANAGSTIRLGVVQLATPGHGVGYDLTPSYIAADLRQLDLRMHATLDSGLSNPTLALGNGACPAHISVSYIYIYTYMEDFSENQNR